MALIIAGPRQNCLATARKSAVVLSSCKGVRLKIAYTHGCNGRLSAISSVRGSHHDQGHLA
jgi:hypothetical protein